ncbi:polyketide synthase [Trichophyton tonsurans CBS 112818]|uniref:Non-reducing polyketide synthase nscA n=1 Tax=Trichophyton tonsurans (strain CBS 112818) TaxID=647933 RepID=F2RRY1_TRIT1|nr:polyketide synthase [Trichophyton tonsurans CBS 112818]
MVNQLHLYLFGDLTYDISTKLQPFLHSQSYPLLRSFFDCVCDKLRAEIGRLPAQDKEVFPRFSSIAELLTWRSSHSRSNPAVENALTCIYQLGEFIHQHEGLGQEYFSPQETCVSGICTGALSAAAVSCCRTASELVPIAVQTVLVAFRLGMCTLRASKAIDPSEGNWSMVVSCDSTDKVEELLCKFAETNNLPITSMPWISAYGEDSWVSISAPASVLLALRSSDILSGMRSRALDIHSPYHAKHIFSKTDIDAILEKTDSQEWERYRAVRAVVSSTTGEVIEPEGLRSRLEAALTQILFEPIRWTQLTQGLAAFMSSINATRFHVISIGTNAEATLIASLSSKMQIEEAQAPGNGESVKPDQHGGEARGNMVRGRSKIAIVGLSGRYPSAENNEEFWDLIFRGLDVHKTVPDLHWSAKTHVDPTGKKKNTSATPYGCWLEHPEAFDGLFFNMSPREAPQVDPAQRIALMTAYEAMEQAGIVPGATPSTRHDRVGVFYGVTSNDWMETNSAQNIDTYFIPGGNRAFIPGRINYFFKFSGPSYSVDTACSSSLASLHIACNSLWQRDIDTAIAGGTNILTNPDFTAGLDRGHFLSRTGNCRTFDDDADGYCRGEGVGTVILKRLEDAIADKDPIHGLILGTYTNHSAEAESITRPHVGAQRDIMRNILSNSGVDPYSVSYVELHGTGTQAGDAREMTSVLDTFAPADARRYRQPDESLHLGSVKSNIGHGEAAAGVSALIKVLLMLRNNTIPPHCGIKNKINSSFPTDLDARNVYIAKKAVSWPSREGQPRRVFINNFSAAGGNSALVLEEKPAEAEIQGTDPRTTHVVTVSAKSAISLSRNIQSLADYIEKHQDEALFLPQLSYTTTARRIHHQHRVAVSGTSAADIKAALEKAAANGDGKVRARIAPKVTFTYTGQGAQYVGMAKQLYTLFDQFKGDINRFDGLAQRLGFPSFLSVIEDESSEQLQDISPVTLQLSSVCMQMALSRLLMSWNIIPDSVIGHSLGEYAALNIAGVLSDTDTIFLVGRRAQLLEQHCTLGTHSMLVVKASLSAVQGALEGAEFEVACINAPEETVLAGPNTQIEVLKESLNSNGFKTKIISVPFAYHSSQVDSILGHFETVATGVRFRKPTIPVISPLLAEVIADEGIIGPSYLRRHCRETVNFLGALQNVKETGFVKDKAFFVEVGPHPIVTGMVKATFGTSVTSMPTLQRSRDDQKVVTELLVSLYSAGTDLRWNEYHRDFEASHKVLELPAYNWDLKNYWMQYVNDWSLRKGDPPLIVGPSSLTSTTIHKVLDDNVDKIVVESDMAREDFNPLVQGHEVDGVPLCTPSVYADIALSIGKYLLERYHPEIETNLVDVANMTVLKALIARAQGPQPLRTIATVDWPAKKASVSFRSYDKSGEPTVEHATCEIRFTDRSRLKLLESSTAAVKARMGTMRETLGSGETQRFNRAMVYKMISPLAQFHRDYQPLDEVIIDSNSLEVSSQVNFKGVQAAGNFFAHPAYIDGLTQAGGFVMNCNDSNDLAVEVFVNHGWESLQLYEPLQKEKKYKTFCHMSPGDNRKFHGDVVVFDESERIVASYKGIVFQGVPRRVLRFFLKPEAPAAPRGQANQKTTARSAPVAPAATAMPTTTPKPIAKPTAAPATASPKSPKVKQAFQIISEEAGVPVEDLTDDCVFTDLGIDSLLALVITSRFREELELDGELDDIFLTYTSGKSLRGYLAKQSGSDIPVVVEPTPLPVVAPKVEPAVASRISIGADCAAALAIVSEESGIAIAELADECILAEIGIDSLLALVIVSRFKEELDVDIDSQSVFTDSFTIRDLKAFFGKGESTITTRAPSILMESSDENTMSSMTPPDSSSDYDTSEKLERIAVPPATSVLLQGIARHAEKILFLFPDGSGSATSYSAIPRLSPRVAVIGLNSPYNKIPELFRCTLDDLIDSYIDEVRRRQPTGPYYFGGWSAGGILAYRAAQKLIEAGEKVLDLVLIDSPVPRGLDKLPQHFYDHCSKYQVFGHRAGPTKGNGKAPAWLIPHFNATIDTLHDYHASPLPAGKTPRTTIIWACESVIDGVNVPKLQSHPDDTPGMKFLSEKRTDFSAAGWEAVFPGGDIILKRMEHANHFSMMKGEHAGKLAGIIKATLT